MWDRSTRLWPVSSATASSRAGGPTATGTSSTPRQRSAGSTTARHGCAGGLGTAGRSRTRGHVDERDRRGAGDDPMTAVLELDAVTRVHGTGATEVTALRAVSFAAHAGELVAV